ncbi:MAG: (2Fe-2S)-binding protein [Desulfitibacter sp. BRH_c19]|nr:MAG: (2Fe-2S)-binding protein [Desulfitibacter sp. BRH_c19]
MEKIIIKLIVNNKEVMAEVKPYTRLIDLLREELGLTGTKEGCGIGECGACTVIVDGNTVNSCLTLAASMEGKSVLTIEGLAQEETLHPLQEAFIRHNAIQCGFCTPGLLMSAKACLDENSNPSREDIKVAISGNLCRCTGYEQVVEAIEEVAAKAKE